MNHHGCRLLRIASTAIVGLAITQLPLRADEQLTEGYLSILASGDLSGWDHPDSWILQNGELRAKRLRDPLTYRRTKMPDAFDLQFEWRLTAVEKQSAPPLEGTFSLYSRVIPKVDLSNRITNSYQVVYQFSVGGGWIALRSPEIVLEVDTKSTRSESFSAAPSEIVALPIGSWNSGRIIWRSGRIEHWVNARKVVDIDIRNLESRSETARLHSLASRLKPKGLYLSVEHNRGSLSFRNLKFKDLGAD